MIRINLLEPQHKAPASGAGPEAVGPAGGDGGGGGAFAGGLTMLGALLIILAGLGFCGWKWYTLTSRIDTLNEDIRLADERIAQLKKALKTMEEYQAKKKALEQRVELISNLKRQQSVPVMLLDMVSRQVPDFLWLEGLEEKGNALSLKGKATTYNAVSQLYNNLRDSQYFSGVSLGSAQKAAEGVSFQMSCQFVPPKPGVEEPAPAGAAPAQPGAAPPAAPAPAAAPPAASAAAPRG